MIGRVNVQCYRNEAIPPDAIATLKQFFGEENHYLKQEEPKFFNEEFYGELELIFKALTSYKFFDIKVISIGTGTMVVKMKDRIEELVSEGVLEEIQHYMRGGIVQVSIPDLGLLLMDEVQHLDDCCTDQLQKELDDGWRILAVCPPNAARRPDYILGRRKRA